MDAVIDACRADLVAKRAARAACAEKERAVMELARSGTFVKSRIHEEIQRALLAEGFTAGDISEMGVSKSNVRLMVARPRV